MTLSQTLDSWYEMAEQKVQHKLDPDLVSLNREDEKWREDLVRLQEKGRKQEIRRLLKEFYSADIAFFLEHLDLEKALLIFGELSQEIQGEVLSELHDLNCRQFLAKLNVPVLSEILRQQPTDRVSHLLEKTDEELRNTLLASLPEKQRAGIFEILAYPEDSAGAMMRKEYVSVRFGDTVKKAISALRNSPHKESIHAVFVCDKEGHYKGHIALNKLVLLRPQSKVERVMEQELMPIPIETDQEEVAKFFTRYNFISAPVVDAEGFLRGRITADDVLEIVQEEASEDILRMGGLGGEEQINTPLLQASIHRVSWLLLNLITAFVSALVIRAFDQTIEKTVMLAALMPIVTSLGSSAGGQSMALAIRQIALGEFSLDPMRKLLSREFLISFLNGALIAALTASIVYFSTQELLLSAIILAALLSNIIIATLSGAFIPRILHYSKIDPAVASVILVTGFSDIMGFFLFLSFAYLAL